MNYSQVGIANLALNRIGARGQITDLNENSPNARKVLGVWDHVFQTVLSERDWKFAKTRAELQLSPQVPLYTWHHAWALPSDYLRTVRPRRRQQNRNNNLFWGWGFEGEGWYHRQDPPVWPQGRDYKVETLPALCTFVGSITGTTLTVTQVTANQLTINQPVTGIGVTPGTFIIALGTGSGYAGTYLLNIPSTVPSEAMFCTFPSSGGGAKYILSNYGGWHGPVKITYIQLITNYTQLMPGFVDCLAYRLAQEVAISITEDEKKYAAMEQMYKEGLNSAEAQNETMDYERDEDGSETWERAGRYVSWYW